MHHVSIADFAAKQFNILHMAKAILLIKGRVQGVFYRYSTREKADALGLSGWVRNLSDGSVEACALGDRARIESLIEWCRVGPPHADVKSVDVNWGGDTEDIVAEKSELLTGKFEIR
ncbi:MAG TPA: acylphosphatase [Drouetiella sp.]